MTTENDFTLLKTFVVSFQVEAQGRTVDVNFSTKALTPHAAAFQAGVRFAQSVGVRDVLAVSVREFLENRVIGVKSK